MEEPGKQEDEYKLPKRSKKTTLQGIEEISPGRFYLRVHKITLKAEINAEASATLNSDTSRPFDKPISGRIAAKVINHLGDKAMKVFRVD